MAVPFGSCLVRRQRRQRRQQHHGQLAQRVHQHGRRRRQPKLELKNLGCLSLSVDPTSLSADLNEAQFALQQKLDEIRHSLWLALNDSSVNESSIQITEVYYQDPFGVRSRLLDDSGVGMDVQMAVVPDFAAANDTTTAPPGTTTPVSTTTAPSNSTSPPSTTLAPVTQGPTQTTPPDDDDDDDSVAGFQIATAVVSALLLTVWQL
ncbi:MAG: hypothetical protein MHM6MM_007292 [Cercozoa sp. M6MM]